MGNSSQTLIIGKRGAGKSWLIRDLIRTNNSESDMCVFSPAEKHTPFYFKNFPNATIKLEYSPGDIRELLDEQTECLHRGSPRNLCLVLDDCLSSRGNWLKDESFYDLLMNGRHYNIALYITMQVPMGMTPEIRARFDTVFLFTDDFISNQKRMYDHYAGMFPDFESFRQNFLNLTGDHSALVIFNRSNSPRLLDRIFWYRAEAEAEDENDKVSQDQNSDVVCDSYQDEELISTIDARIQSRLSNLGCLDHLSLAAHALSESVSDYFDSLSRYLEK